MKKKITAILICVCCLTACLMCFGCHKNAPWDYCNVEWYSESPIIELHTEYSGEPSVGFIEIDGNKTEVYLYWGPPTYAFSIRIYNPENGFLMGTDRLLLRGRVKYNSTSATLKIQEDNIFDNEYKSIVLYRRELNS